MRREKSLTSQCVLLGSDGSSGRSLTGARRQIAAAEPRMDHTPTRRLTLLPWTFDIGHSTLDILELPMSQHEEASR